MRLDHDDSPWCSAYNPFDGDAGSALYVSPADDTDSRNITYRNLRLLSPGPASVCDQFPALGDGPLGLDAHVALSKTPDPLEWTLPADYLSADFFVVNVRPHKSGLELDTIAGWQYVQVVGGEAGTSVLGSVLVISTTKLDGGGLRVWFRYYPAVEGPQPDTFEIRDTEDPATITTVSVSAADPHDYYIDLAGLESGTDYTFAIVGLVDAAETNLTTFDVAGDDDGPDVELTLTAEVF